MDKISALKILKALAHCSVAELSCEDCPLKVKQTGKCQNYTDADVVAAVKALSDEEQTKPNGWISVNDRLPDTFKPVIVCRENRGKGERMVEQGYSDVNGWWKVHGTRTKSVTHWIPLPEPPEGE